MQKIDHWIKKCKKWSLLKQAPGPGCYCIYRQFKARGAAVAGQFREKPSRSKGWVTANRILKCLPSIRGLDIFCRVIFKLYFDI